MADGPQLKSVVPLCMKPKAVVGEVALTIEVNVSLHIEEGVGRKGEKRA